MWSVELGHIAFLFSPEIILFHLVAPQPADQLVFLVLMAYNHSDSLGFSSIPIAVPLMQPWFPEFHEFFLLFSGILKHTLQKLLRKSKRSFEIVYV